MAAVPVPVGPPVTGVLAKGFGPLGEEPLLLPDPPPDDPLLPDPLPDDPLLPDPPPDDPLLPDPLPDDPVPLEPPVLVPEPLPVDPPLPDPEPLLALEPESALLGRLLLEEHADTATHPAKKASEAGTKMEVAFMVVCASAHSY
jgi:hypothetical protein